MSANDYLTEFAVESGEVVVLDDQSDAVTDLLVDEIAAGDVPLIADTLDHADTTEEIADQLDHLADVSERVAATDDQPAIDASVESLNIAYGAIMRAYKLKLPTTSFESAVGSKAQLQGLAKDARKHATTMRNYRESVIDYSEEGAIKSFFRRDESKIEKAFKALREAEEYLKRRADNINARPVVIELDGIKRFMTISRRQIDDIKGAIATEASWLKTAHDAVEQGAIDLKMATEKLIRNPKQAIGELEKAVLFKAAKNAASAQGGLMGNHSVAKSVEDDANANYPGLSVPKYKRFDNWSFDGSAAGWAVLNGLVSGIAWKSTARLAAVLAVMIGAPGAVAGGLMAHAGKIGAAMAIKGTFDAYKDGANSTRRKAVNTPQELVDSCQMIFGYDKYLSYRIGADDLQNAIKAARKAGDDLSSEEKKALKEICSDLEDALSRLVRLAECTYEQAFYTTTMMASVIRYAVGKRE